VAQLQIRGNERERSAIASDYQVRDYQTVRLYQDTVFSRNFYFLTE